MLLHDRKTVYIKILKKNPRLQSWPEIHFCDRGRCLHIDVHFITLSKNERVYQFTPYRTSFFTIDLPDPDGRYVMTRLAGFPETVTKALFKDKKNVQFPC